MRENGAVTLSMLCVAAFGGCAAPLPETGEHEAALTSISNPGFEDGLTGWGQVEPASLSSVAHGGASSAKVSSTGGTVKRTIGGLSAGHSYVLSGWLLGSATIGVRNAGTTEVRTTKTASSWTQVTVAFTTGSSSTSAEIYAVWAGGGDARVDDFSVASGPSKLSPASVTASTNDGHLPAEAVDGDLGTRWSGYGDGAWLRLDLGGARTVSYVKVAVYEGDTRKNRFDLQVSADGSAWTTVWSGSSSGTTTARQTYDFPDVQARYVRYLGHGYVQDGTTKLWSSVTEMGVYGTGSDAASGGSDPGTGCAVPAQILDLAGWKETLPVGTAESPTEIMQPKLASYALDPWFRATTACDSVQFRAPTSGVTTSGSGYPRSELREMSSDGSAKASWSTSSGTHTMFIDEAITAVPRGKQHVVAGQIHDADDDVIVIRLEYPKLFIDINGETGPTLDSNYTLGKRFTVQFVAASGKVKIYYNGASTPAYTLTRSASGCYFKAGAYTQSNCDTESDAGATCGDDDYGEVRIFDVWVRHQ